jgi:MraZ protein
VVKSGKSWSAGVHKPGVPSIKAQVEQMFLGRYEHAIDEKGRVTIPVRYRELLENGAFVCQGFDRNLMVLTASSFDQISERVNETSLTDPIARQLKRLIFSSAERCEFDRAGRLLLPQFLREAAQLEENAILVGVGDYFEIWSPTLWALQNETLQDADANMQRFAALNLSLRSA